MKMARFSMVFCFALLVFLTACSSALIVDPGSNTLSQKTSNTIQKKNGTSVINTSTVGRLTGVNWPGFDSDVRVVHALWGNGTGARDYKSMLKQIKDLGFNCIRIPFCTEMVDQLIYPDWNAICISQWVADNYTGQMGVNTDLQGLTCVDILDKIIAEAGNDNLKIILDDHSHLTNHYWLEPLWYFQDYTEARWISNWTTLVTRFQKYPNFIGVDLKNEPHGDPSQQPATNCATWGGPAGTDWHAAAERCASAIYSADPNLIIVLQGVQVVNGESDWWGSNHRGLLTIPFTSVPSSQILYSVHEYGPEVQDQIWFHDPTFPNNMPTIWNHFFNFIEQQNIGTVYVGEFGILEASVTNPSSVPYQWFNTFLTTFGKSLSWTYWAWTGYLADTTGLLSTNDSVSINMDIYKKIQPYLAPQTGGISTASSSSLSSIFSSSSSSVSLIASSVSSTISSSGTLPSGNGLTIQSFQNGATVSDEQYVRINIVNNGSTTINMSTAKVRYYIQDAGYTSWNFTIDYSILGAANINSVFAALIPGITSADRYLELTFTAGAGNLAPGASAEIQGRIYRNDWANFDVTTWYSYNPATAYVNWNKVTGYINGSLVWGIEPNGNSAGSQSSSSSAPVVSSSSSSPISTSSSSAPVISSSSSAPASSSSSAVSSSSSGVVYTTITAPFTFDGAGTYHWKIAVVPNYINDWNLSALNINGVSFLNLYVSSSQLPAQQSGYYYIDYIGPSSYSHFEIK